MTMKEYNVVGFFCGLERDYCEVDHAHMHDWSACSKGNKCILRDLAEGDFHVISECDK